MHPCDPYIASTPWPINRPLMIQEIGRFQREIKENFGEIKKNFGHVSLGYDKSDPGTLQELKKNI